jgi:hypothetical protein
MIYDGGRESVLLVDVLARHANISGSRDCGGCVSRVEPLPGLRRSPWSSLRFEGRGHYRRVPSLQAEGEAVEKLSG